MSRFVIGRSLCAALLLGLAVAWAEDRKPDGSLGDEDDLAAALTPPEGVHELPALRSAVERCLLRLQQRPFQREALSELATLYHANGYAAPARILYDRLIQSAQDAEERARLNYLAADAVKGTGDTTLAADYLENSLRASRSYPLALARLGEARLKENQPAQAEALFDEALALDPTLAPAQLGMARSLIRGDRLGEALQHLDALLASDPGNYNAQALRARALTALGEHEEAQFALRGVTRSSDPPLPDPWLEPVRAAILDPQRLDFLFLDYFVIGDYETALFYLDRMEQVDPGNARYSRYRGIVHMKREQFPQASSAFREGLARGGDDRDLYPLLAQSLARQGLLEEAEASARKGLTESPTGPLQLELARILVERGELAEALQRLAAALELDPYEVETHLLRGRVAMTLGKEETARESLQLVQQLAPSNLIVLVRSALIYMEASRFGEALPALDRALRLAPGAEDVIELLVDARLQLAQEAAQSGRLQDAATHLDVALAADPGRRDVLLAAAQLQIRLQRFDQAESTLRSYIESGKHAVELLVIYGDLLARRGQGDEARRIWEQALKRMDTERPRSPSNREGLLRRLQSLPR